MPPRMSTPPRSAPPIWTPPPAGTVFMTGAVPSTRQALMSAVPFQTVAAPAQFAIVPNKLSVWGNNRYGICVTSEEAYAKACHLPSIFVEESIVIAWAQKRGVLNGAMLDDVLDKMHRDGFQVGSQRYDDGPKQSVDWRDEANLKAAISTQGNVKIAMASSTLSGSGAGSRQGYYCFGNKGGRGSDHCTGFSGYGTAGYCFAALGMPVPSGVDPSKPDCYLHFTWGTIGVVDKAWIDGTTTEAWVRQPTTVGVPPIPEPPLDWNFGA